MGIMAIINLVCLMLIGKLAVASYKDYMIQLKAGKDPKFIPENIEELKPYLKDINAWD